MPEWKPIIRARLAGTRFDEDLVEEIAQHADDRFSALVANGSTEDEARRSVEAEMLDLRASADAARALRAGRLPPAAESSARWWSPAGFARDVVYGARVLAARPGFAAVAVVTLALGIGANTAIFSVVNALLLQPLPFPNPDRLVNVWESSAGDPQDMFIVSAPNWRDWVEQSTSFEHLAIWGNLRFNIAGGVEPEQVPGLRMSSSTFAVFGLRPSLGRTFTAAEEAPGHRVVVISDALWRRRYGASTAVVGSAMRLNGEAYEIVGVMPPAFAVMSPEYAVWVPIAFNEQDASRGAHSFYAAGRLKPGVSFETAQAEMDAIGRRLARQYPDSNRDESAGITRMEGLGVAYLRPTLLMLQGAVALVLLIACVNVANLLLAQASARQREFAIRISLGAARARIARQLLAEALVLSLLGGLAGAGLAWLGTSALAGAAPRAVTLAPYRVVAGMQIDAWVLLFTLTLAIATGVLFSFAPMVGLTRLQAASTLKSGGDRGSTGRLAVFRVTLVAIEVALAVVILVAAGLMIKSMTRLISVPSGLDARNVAVMEMALPQPDFYGPPVRTSFCVDVSREVGAVPGVGSVGAISHLPLTGANAGRAFTIEGVPTAAETTAAAYRVVCPGYFSTLGIAILAGRDFSHADTTTGAQVIIINSALARKHWPKGDPIGKRLKFGRPTSTNPWYTIVGVAADVRHFGLENDVRPEFYRPYSQSAWPEMTITVKATANLSGVLPGVRAALATIGREQPVTRLRSMESVVIESVGRRRFPMLLLGAFAMIALLLAASGVYGVVSCVVAQRTREIGIRMALGARALQVIRLVVVSALVPVVAGLAIGVAGALAGSRAIATLLFQVKPADPEVLAAIVATLGASAVAASLIPARRAASVDPLVALKEE